MRSVSISLGENLEALRRGWEVARQGNNAGHRIEAVVGEALIAEEVEGKNGVVVGGRGPAAKLAPSGSSWNKGPLAPPSMPSIAGWPTMRPRLLQPRLPRRSGAGLGKEETRALDSVWKLCSYCGSVAGPARPCCLDRHGMPLGRRQVVVAANDVRAIDTSRDETRAQTWPDLALVSEAASAKSNIGRAAMVMSARCLKLSHTFPRMSPSATW